MSRPPILMEWFDGVSLWDHHCHTLVNDSAGADIERFARCLTEAPKTYPLADIKETVVYQEALRVAGAALGVEPTTEAVARSLGAVDWREYCRRLFSDSGYERLFIDTGYSPDGGWDVSQMAKALQIPVCPIMRLETTAEALLPDATSFDEWLERYLAAVRGARGQGYFGAKSIVAYRSGLQVAPVPRERAKNQWRQMRDTHSTRLQDPDLLNYLLYWVTPALIDQQLPLQFHTGYGDPDTDLLKGNPLMLRDYLERFAGAGHLVALLHTYPYHRQAGYLASVYPGVYVDVSLASPLAASGAARIWHELLELAPVSRVLFASDSHSRPESYVLAARYFKQALGDWLDIQVTRHYVGQAVAQGWAQRVAFGNSRRLYGP